LTRIPVNGIEMHVEEHGVEGGEPILFLHGALAAGAAFRSQRVAILNAMMDETEPAQGGARRRFRLHFADLRGHGQSTHLGGAASERLHAWSTLDPATMTQDVLELMDAISPARPVHLVGASLGGILAARATASAPRRVASLALLGTSAVAGPKRAAHFARLTPETLPRGTQMLSAKWHGEPYWRELAAHLFAQIARQTPDIYPSHLAPPRALVMQSVDDEILEPREAEIWVERIDAPVTLVRPPGDHAFFADGRSGSKAANAALLAHLAGA
jgi:pimeloyl-ACP methyl ester carboxylesterase